jgi:FtsH-binding integral membrane protein
MAFLQKVYILFLLGLGSATGGAVFVMNNLPLAQTILLHPFISFFVLIGSLFVVMPLRKVSGVNVLALLGFTFISGSLIGPIFMMLARAQAMDLVFEAAAITGSIFVGLTAYTFISKKDFSFLSGIVWVGLTAVIAIGFINYFVQSSAANLALAWISSVLFSLFVLYDTSRIMRTHESDEYVSAAISLYLDFLNLFLSILNILMSSRSRN